MAKPADLTAYLFEGETHPGRLSADLAQWMETSARFTAFVETYRDKIRKKIRVTRDPESVLDLRAELEVAYCLLSDRRLVVTYEPYASAKRRGPDFAIAYRVNQVFNIEVARLRGEASGGAPNEARPRGNERPVGNDRILRILLYKLGQMQPGMANLLLVHTHAELAHSIDLGRLMQEIKTRVEGKDPAFYAASRYTGPAAFYKDFLHLSGILLWAGTAQLWVNKQSRPGLDEKVQRLVANVMQAQA